MSKIILELSQPQLVLLIEIINDAAMKECTGLLTFTSHEKNDLYKLKNEKYQNILILLKKARDEDWKYIIEKEN